MNLTHTLAQFKRHYSQEHREARRNPWFLAWLGLVVVFLSVNAAFIVTAVVTNPGLVSEDYYEQGRAYERHAIDRLAAQNRLGWEARLEVPQQIFTNTPDVYRFSAVDARGVPVADAEVQVTAYRPSDAGADFHTPLDQLAPGLYQARLGFALPGIWDLNISVKRGDDSYQQSQRISVQTP